jgi:RNA polymerase sigma-70 factor (ECF subfamily)
MQGDGSLPDIEELVDRHLDGLYRFACRLAGNPIDAEDIVQETFLIAHQKLHQVRDRDHVPAWLFKVLRSCWAKRCEREAREAAAMGGGGALDDIPDEAAFPPELPDAIDVEQLLAELDQMPNEFREPLLLFYFQEFRYREIADIVGCPIGTVMSRLARGKAYLRSRLAPEPCSEPR